MITPRNFIKRLKATNWTNPIEVFEVQSIAGEDQTLAHIFFDFIWDKDKETLDPNPQKEDDTI